MRDWLDAVLALHKYLNISMLCIISVKMRGGSMLLPKQVKKIILAYSGGLDTSVMLHWLKKQARCEIVAYCADIGQGAELQGLEEKALRHGASKLIVVDLKEEFAADYIFTALKAQALYEGIYLMGTSLARPLIAKKQIDIAKAEDADAVAHGATGKGNDQVRFELSYYALCPNIQVIAPWRVWPFSSRSELIAYAKEHHIEVEATLDKPYSIDRNLMHTSYEGGILEDPWYVAPEEIFQRTRSIKDTPDQPVVMEIEFANGIPKAIDGQAYSSAELVEKLNQKGGTHGVGRIDIVENRYVGIKSRGIYETPGLSILHCAHRALESITVDREALHLRDSMAVKIAEIIYYGFWFSPEFKMIRVLLDEMQKMVNGVVKLRLHKGTCMVLGRKSPDSLYSPQLASFEKDLSYSQQDAEGFIKLNALRLKTYAERDKKRDAVQIHARKQERV